MRPTIPALPTDLRAVAIQAWIDAQRAAFLWDAQQAGFTSTQAGFLLSRYGWGTLP